MPQVAHATKNQVSCAFLYINIKHFDTCYIIWYKKSMTNWIIPFQNNKQQIKQQRQNSKSVL